MSLRIKIPLFIITALGFSIVALYLVISQNLNSSFKQIESESAMREYYQVKNAFQSIINNLHVKSADWANWDDTYAFTLDKSPAYIQSNLLPSTLTNLGIDIMLFYDSNGQKIYDVSIDLNSQTFLDYITNHPQMLSQDMESALSGTLSLPEGIFLFSARPILTSSGKGPAHGTIIFGQLLDADVKQSIKNVIDIDFTFDPTLSTAPIQTDTPTISTTQKQITTSGLIADHNGNVILNLKVNDNRTIFNQGQISIQYLLIAISTMAAITTIIIILIINYFFVTRLFSLTSLVQNIGQKKDFSLRVPEKGHDELSKLSQDINSMLTNLDQSQRQVNSILSSLGEGLFVIDRNMCILHINPTAQKPFGLTPANIGQKYTDLIQLFKNDGLTPPEDRPVYLTMLNGQSYTATTKDRYQLYSLVNQAKLPVSFVTSPLKDKSDNIIGAVIAFRDVSEEIKLESQLTFERERAASIISSMGEGLILIDSNHNISLVNPAAESLLEIKATETIGKNWSQIISASKGDASLSVENRSFAQTLSEGKIVITRPEDNHYYTTSTGKKFPIASITAPLYTNGKISGAIKVFRDVSIEKATIAIIENKVVERTKALTEAKNQISEAWLLIQREKVRLTASINSLSLGFIMFDTEENVIHLNPTAPKLLKLDHAPSTMSEVEVLVQNLHAKHLECQQTGKQIELPEVEYQNQFLKIFLSPIITSTPTREYIGTAMVIQDITEAKIIDRSKNEFFSIASHELRTPLTAIRGNTSMILDYFQDSIKDPTLKDMLSDIHDSSIRLIGIVEDFLNISRLEQGRMQFKITNFDLIPMLKDTIVELTETAAAKGLALKLDSEIPSTLQINADTNKTKEVVLNLIGNAVKYTDTGSITLSLSQDSQMAKILVSDTGRGIAPANQRLLFRKFQQAGDSLYTRDTTKGTGLGLYISRLMAEGMRGEIGLDWSDVGRGSRFYFTVPLAKNA